MKKLYGLLILIFLLMAGVLYIGLDARLEPEIGYPDAIRIGVTRYLEGTFFSIERASVAVGFQNYGFLTVPLQGFRGAACPLREGVVLNTPSFRPLGLVPKPYTSSDETVKPGERKSYLYTIETARLGKAMEMDPAPTPDSYAIFFWVRDDRRGNPLCADYLRYEHRIIPVTVTESTFIPMNQTLF